MRIGIDIRALMEGKITGVQVYITNLLESLFEIDKENEYVLFGNSFGSRNQELGIRNYGRNVQIKIFNYPNKFFLPAQKYLNVPKVDNLLGGIDLFFSPHWRLTALNKKIPLIVTFHDLSFEVAPSFFTLRQRLWHKFMDYRYAANRANQIIAVSENTKADLVDLYGVSPGKIKVIYPGVRPPLHLPQTSGEKERGYFLYFGTFEPRKNIDTLLQAYLDYRRKSSRKKSLVLAGSSGWKTKIRIPEELRGEIKIIQNPDESEKQRLFQNAFALVFLSFYEGFGFPILEAASYGVPVISSFATSLQEIGHDFVLLVNPFRHIQVSRAMLELESDQAFYRNLRLKGLAASKIFDWRKTARETLELFKTIL